MSFENIYQKIGELKELLIPLNEKINFLYTINQLDKSKMIYKLNLNELIRNLEVYEQYMLKKIIEITSKDWEIGIDELFTEKQLKDVLKHGLLDLFSGDAKKLMDWTEKNFPKFHEEVKINVEANQKIETMNKLTFQVFCENCNAHSTLKFDYPEKERNAPYNKVYWLKCLNCGVNHYCVEKKVFDEIYENELKGITNIEIFKR